MEVWFLADRNSPTQSFGAGFNPDVLPVQQDIEQIAKGDVLEALWRSDAMMLKGKGRKGTPLV